jgi:hypothetical protein
MGQERLRGRPPKQTREADDVIARSVYALASFGFSLRPKSAAGDPRAYALGAVALAAKEILGRTDDAGRALSTDRVRQLLAQWRLRERAKHTWITNWNRFSADELRLRMPWGARGKTVLDLARVLVAQGGHWHRSEDEIEVSRLAPHGDMPLTAAAQREYLRMPRVVFKGG